MNNKVIMFPGMEREKEELSIKKKEAQTSNIKKAVNDSSSTNETTKSVRTKKSETPVRVKTNKAVKKKPVKRRGALSIFVRNIVLVGKIVKKVLKVKAVRRIIFSASAICLVGFFTFPKVMNLSFTENVTVTSSPVEEDSISYVEIFNSELDEKFKESIGETTSLSNKEITEDVVVKITPKIKGEEVPSYLVSIKATLPYKKISKNEDGTLEYDMKDIEYVVMSIEPNLSEKELEMMDEKSIDAMYKEKESLRKKAIKELSQSEESKANVLEAINEALYN